MGAYAVVADVQNRMLRQMSEDEENVCAVMIGDAETMVDATGTEAGNEVKKLVVCRMVIRAIGDGAETEVPIGASQGSMSALGYTASWTLSGGSAGELYISKAEKKLLGLGNRIGSYSPIEELVPEVTP